MCVFFTTYFKQVLIIFLVKTKDKEEKINDSELEKLTSFLRKAEERSIRVSFPFSGSIKKSDPVNEKPSKFGVDFQPVKDTYRSISYGPSISTPSSVLVSTDISRIICLSGIKKLSNLRVITNICGVIILQVFILKF